METIIFPVIFLFIALVFHLYMCSVVYEKAQQKLKCRDPLPDLLHDRLPNTRKYKNINEILLVAYLLSFLYILISRRGDLLPTYITLIAVIYIVRALCYTCTILPDASQECEPINIGNVIQNPLTIFNGSCYDLMFSGHTSIVTLSLLFVIFYGLARTQMEKYYFVSLATVITILTVTSRNHYTIDAIMGVFVSLSIFLLHYSSSGL